MELFSKGPRHNRPLLVFDGRAIHYHSFEITGHSPAERSVFSSDSAYMPTSGTSYHLVITRFTTRGLEIERAHLSNCVQALRPSGRMLYVCTT
jgi:hypothetical protein